MPEIDHKPKLLIITQTLDTTDPVLGFFHRWVEEFARHSEQVHVLALNIGTHALPANVAVYGLGKSEGKSKWTWFWRLLWLSFKLRRQYDYTFTHMTPIHVALAGPLWRLLGKRIGLWYTHPSVDLKLRVATFFSHVTFTGSDSSFNIATPKKNVMGQGVDPDFLAYKPALNLHNPTLIVVGRISPIKHVENAIDTLAELTRATARLVVVGGPLTPEDETYLEGLQRRAVEKGVADRVIWRGALPADKMQPELQAADIFVHTSLTHSADKTLPEAMSTGLFCVSSNRAYEADLPSLCFHEPNPKLYADAIETFIALPATEQETLRRKLRVCVEEKHSLKSLVNKILTLY